MNKLLFLSLILNFLLLVLFSYCIVKKGGMELLSFKKQIANSKQIKNEMPAPNMPEWYYQNSREWHEKRDLYAALPNEPDEILFVGNSLTYACNWTELFQNPKIKNRGINGDNTEGLLERLDEITESKPDKIFLMIGINDIGYGLPFEYVVNNYNMILQRIKSETPNTRLYLQSVLPVKGLKDRDNKSIIALNEKIETLANENKSKYINLFPEFLDTHNELSIDYSSDGLHLNTEGYLLWKKLIENYVAE